MRLLTLVIILTSYLIADKFDDYFKGKTGSQVQNQVYIKSQNNQQCHCQFYISEAFIKHTENDMTAELYQMNIDQRNFVKHFLADEMKLGLKNELIGINELYLQTNIDLSLLDEMIFLTNKLNKHSEITQKSNGLIIKSMTKE